MTNTTALARSEQQTNALASDHHAATVLSKPRNGFWLDAVYPATSGTYRISHYKIEGDPTLEAVTETHAKLSRSMAPAPDREVLMELNRLWALTSHKSQSAPELDITLEAYSEKLKSYPRDAVVETLREAPELSQWWPTWKELKTEIEKKCRRRGLALEALERKINEFSGKETKFLDRYRRMSHRSETRQESAYHLEASRQYDD